VRTALFRWRKRASALRLFVIVRRSPDWGRLTQEEFEAQARLFCRAVHRPEEQVIDTARLWDTAFPLSYCQTRQTLKDIAGETLRALRPEQITTGEAPIPVPPPGAVYVICDDDDWLSPDLPTALNTAALRPYDGVVWGNAVFGPLKKAAREPVLEVPDGIELRPLDRVCHSNNYAVTSRYLERAAGVLDHVFSHGIASQTFQSLEIAQIRSYLSVKNTNPTSTVFLENGLRWERSRQRLIDLVRQYVERAARGVDTVSEDLRWAMPQMVQVVRLFAQLLQATRP